MNRRSFVALGWFLSISFATAIVVMFRYFLIGGRLTSRFFTDLLLSLNRPTRRRQLGARVSNPGVHFADFVISQRNIVHWPAPGLYKLHARVAKSREIVVDKTWHTKVSAEIATCRSSKAGRVQRALVPRFEKLHEGLIRETLALREFSVAVPPDADSAKKALKVLQPALRSQVHPCNWRVIELCGRLACLSQPNDSSSAYKLIRQTIPAHPNRPKRLGWIVDPDAFRQWHTLTIDSTSQFQKRFSRRIEKAHRVSVAGSSSRKDTPPGSKLRSNRRPAPPIGTPSSSPRHRRTQCPTCIQPAVQGFRTQSRAPSVE
jgi:hypothetical protein